MIVFSASKSELIGFLAVGGSYSGLKKVRFLLISQSSCASMHASSKICRPNVLLIDFNLNKQTNHFITGVQAWTVAIRIRKKYADYLCSLQRIMDD